MIINLIIDNKLYLEIQSTIDHSNGKLGYKEDLTYKQLENLIREASRKLNRNNFEFYPTNLFQ